jgi:hypothetical protein
MVFIVNKGFPWYLPYVVRQIEIANGKDSAILILDKTYPEAVKFSTLQMKDYSRLANDFERVFRSFFREDGYHEFELIWFERYMFVLEYLESIHYKADFWIVDSDVMIYSNLAKVKILNGMRLTRGKEQEPCFTWFKETSILRDFCEYIIDRYINHLSELESFFVKNYIEGTDRGGICEMIFLRWFADEHISICQDIAVPIDGWAFDIGMQGHDGYRRNPIGGKKIYWDKGKPYGIKNRTRINFHGLHCQGYYKNLIPVYFSGESKPEEVARGKAWQRSVYFRNGPKYLLKRVVGRE